MSDRAAACWVVKRNCSASPAQLAAVLASIAALSTAIGIAFALVGPWLVLPFVGVEIAALALAFLFYSRHAADRERIDVSAAGIAIRRDDGAQARSWNLALPGAHIEFDRRDERARVYVAAHGERVEVGRHLCDRPRLALARELRRALRAAAT
jgi:uncharacterized membrane protein